MQKQWAMFSIQKPNLQTLQPDLHCTKFVQVQHAISNLKWTVQNATYKSQMDIKTDIKGTTRNTKPQMNIKSKHMQEKEPSAATQEKQFRQTDEPVLPKIKWNKDSIELNDKVHRLPITKDYILKEFSDVFKGVGTLPGGPYYIRLKDDYKPVQHTPRSVPIAMQPAYKAELERLTKGRHHHRSTRTHRMDQLYSTSNETRW